MTQDHDEPATEPEGGAATPRQTERLVRREHFKRCHTTQWLQESREVLLLFHRCAVVVGAAALPTENAKGGEASAEAFRVAAVARGGADDGRVRRRFGRNYDRCFRCSDPPVREHRRCRYLVASTSASTLVGWRRVLRRPKDPPPLFPCPHPESQLQGCRQEGPPQETD